MHSLYRVILNWAEVWPLALALVIVILYKQKDNGITIIIGFLSISLVLHTLATFISLYTYKIPEPFKNNNILYNLLTILKPLIIGTYLLRLKQLQQYKYLRILFVIFILFTIFNFLFLENILMFSTYMVLAESAFMLIFTLTFFLNAMIDDEIPLPLSHPAYYICAAISILESINFFIYLFLYPVYYANLEFALLSMNIASVAYIIYGLIIAAGLFANRERRRVFNYSAKNEQ